MMNINFTKIYYFSPLLLLILVLILIFYYRKQIAQLKTQIKTERARWQTPLLNFTIDRKELSLRIINEGDIIAKDILIEDVEATLDIGFPKTLLFHFDQIDILKPNETAVVKMSILEKGAAVPPGMIERMGGVMVNVSFTAYVHCKNLEGIPFCIELIKTGTDCKISRIALNEQKQ